MAGACAAMSLVMQVENQIHSTNFEATTSTTAAFQAKSSTGPSLQLYVNLEMPACSSSLSTSPLVWEEMGRCGKPKPSQVARGCVEKGDMCKRDHRKGGTITEESLDMLVAGGFSAQPHNHNTFTQQSHTFSQPQVPIW